MISRTRWVVPVCVPKCELEIRLDTSINLCKRGLDTRSEACQQFFQEGLTKSFTKILTDEAVSSWKFEIHRCILRNCEKLIELCVTKLSQDWFPLLDLLAVVLNLGSRGTASGSPNFLELRRSEECGSYLLHEFSSAAVVYDRTIAMWSSVG